jgi:hypothetical protein
MAIQPLPPQNRKDASRNQHKSHESNMSHPDFPTPCISAAPYFFTPSFRNAKGSEKVEKLNEANQMSPVSRFSFSIFQFAFSLFRKHKRVSKNSKNPNRQNRQLPFRRWTLKNNPCTMADALLHRG